MMEKYMGAEATVEVNSVVTKRREKKAYRHPELDERIRRERTEKEADMLEKASRAGANVPSVREKTGFELELEKIEGKKLRERAERKKLKELGEEVAKLHEFDMIHGDLTTSNAIVNDEGVFLIDFGLSGRSERTEDRAVDLHLLKNIIESSHSERSETLWEAFLEGYNNFEDSENVREILQEVQERGRYK